MGLGIYPSLKNQNYSIVNLYVFSRQPPRVVVRQPASPGDVWGAFSHAGKVLDSLGDITFDMV